MMMHYGSSSASSSQGKMVVRRRFFSSTTTAKEAAAAAAAAPAPAPTPPPVVNLPAPPVRVALRTSLLASVGIMSVGAVGVGVGHGLSYVFGGQPDESAEQQQAFFSPLQLGALGASSVLIFGAPAAPFAQPRNVLGGHCYSFAVGTLVAAAVSTGATLMSCDCFPFSSPSSLLPASVSSVLSLDFVAGALSVGAAVGGMQLLRVVHPPAGGTALAVATTITSSSSSSSSSDGKGSLLSLLTAPPTPLLGMAFGVTLGASTLIAVGAIASRVFPLFRMKTTTVAPYKYPAYWI